MLNGPTSQNRDAHPDFRAHLAGRVAHAAALNAARSCARCSTGSRGTSTASAVEAPGQASASAGKRRVVQAPGCNSCNAMPRTAIIRAMPRQCHGAAHDLPQPFAVRSHAACRALPARSVFDARRRFMRVAQTMPAQANDSPM
ncbi:hypothetical protein LXM88_01180 [Burkholderia sp. S-53]|nr:hypothetical protein [Burkholderia sp. S-53]UXU85926.1 hypothetical protein LXM88_01180 [Burkholderia sp. S-53]